MTEDVGALQRELRRLYSQHEYALALDLLDQHPDIFSQQSMLYHWRMCLAARADEPDRAIQAFSEALEHGHAYPPALIRDDADLASLQGLAGFEELAARNEQRAAEVELRMRPELIVIPPAGSMAGRAPLLLGLHGNSQNARMAVEDWSPIIDKGWMLACAQSTQMLTTDAFVWNDLARGTSDVQQLFGTLDVGVPSTPSGWCWAASRWVAGWRSRWR